MVKYCSYLSQAQSNLLLCCLCCLAGVVSSLQSPHCLPSSTAAEERKLWLSFDISMTNAVIKVLQGQCSTFLHSQKEQDTALQKWRTKFPLLSMITRQYGVQTLHCCWDDLCTVFGSNSGLESPEPSPRHSSRQSESRYVQPLVVQRTLLTHEAWRQPSCALCAQVS